MEEGRAAYGFWSSRNGCKREEKLSGPCVEAEDCSAGADGGARGGAEVVYCELPGMGHSWPRYAGGQPLDGTFTILASLLHVMYSISTIPPPSPPPPSAPPAPGDCACP